MMLYTEKEEVHLALLLTQGVGCKWHRGKPKKDFPAPQWLTGLLRRKPGRLKLSIQR